MLEIREDQLEALRSAVRAGLPDAFVQDMGARGVDARQVGRSVLSRDRRGFETRVEFREDGAPDGLVMPSGEAYRFELDAAGRLAVLSHSGGARVELERDDDGRVVSVRQGGSEGYRFGYERDQLTALRDPDGSERRFEYDDGGHLVATVSRVGARKEYARDADGTLVSVRDALGRTTQYDTTQGALRAIVHPDGSREEFAFDPDARLGAVTRRDGGRVFQELDESGAVRSITWPDGSWVVFDLDGERRLRGVRNASGAVRFEHDAMGQTVREKTADGVVQLAYDPEGRVTRVITPDGDSIGYDYDGDGRLLSVVDWEGRRQRFGYGEDGTVREIRYGNGLLEQQRYGSACRLTHARVSDGTRTVSEQRYRYDVCGRLDEIEDLHGNEGWTRRLAHDADDRLTSVVDASGHVLERYEYDLAGNLVRDGAHDIAVGPMDQPLSMGDEPIHYDPQGNITRLPGVEGRIECQFAPDGSLAETRVGDRTIRYAYDALGRRVLKTDGVRSWRYGWVGHQLLWEEFQEAPGARGVRRDYLWCPDSFVPLAFREGGRTYWIQCDTRGAPIRVFRKDGTTAWSARYDAFGNVEVDIAHVRQPWRLMGQYHDDETGLCYSLCRYYSPRIKSFLSRDPLWYEPGAANYAYAKNSPYTYADPFGGPFFLLAAVAAVAVGAVVGAVVAAATGGDPIAGAVDGAVSVVGGILGGIVGGMIGGPVGMVAGAMVGSSLGAAAGSLTENLRSGDPVCWPCALKAAGVALAIDAALLGLGKIPGVRQVAKRVGTALRGKGRAVGQWARRKLSTAFPGTGRRWADRLAQKGAKTKPGYAPISREAFEQRGRDIDDNLARYDKLPDGARPPRNPRWPPDHTVEQRLEWANKGHPDTGERIPLQFKDVDEYRAFQKDLDGVLRKHGIDDATVAQMGSGTRGWSPTPGKVVDVEGTEYLKPWKPGADTDFAIFSDKALNQAYEYDVIPQTKIVVDDKFTMFKNGGQPPASNGFSDTPLGKDLDNFTADWNDKFYGTRTPPDGVDFKLNMSSDPSSLDRIGGGTAVVNQGGGG